jgi:hypothetical protein
MRGVGGVWDAWGCSGAAAYLYNTCVSTSYIHISLTGAGYEPKMSRKKCRNKAVREKGLAERKGR